MLLTGQFKLMKTDRLMVFFHWEEVLFELVNAQLWCICKWKLRNILYLLNVRTRSGYPYTWGTNGLTSLTSYGNGTVHKLLP